MKIKLKTTQDELEVSVFLWLARLLAPLPTHPPTYTSSRYGISFLRMQEYWEELGRREAAVAMLAKPGRQQIRALTTEELIQLAFAAECGAGQGVVLFSINREEIGRLADQLPGANSKLFLEDFLFIPAASRESARKAVEKIPAQLAFVAAIDRGLIFAKNYDEGWI